MSRQNAKRSSSQPWAAVNAASVVSSMEAQFGSGGGSCQSGLKSRADSTRGARFGPAATGFLLFARQPLTQRGDQVVVSQLVVLLVFISAAGSYIVRTNILSFGFGGRDQPQLAVKNLQHVAEVARSVGVPRALQQSLGRLHLPLDVGARFG